MEIKYNEPIEVNKLQYEIVTKIFCGAIAHREENGKYFIKVWNMSIKNNLILKLLSL